MVNDYEQYVKAYGGAVAQSSRSFAAPTVNHLAIEPPPSLPQTEVTTELKKAIFEAQKSFFSSAFS